LAAGGSCRLFRHIGTEWEHSATIAVYLETAPVAGSEAHAFGEEYLRVAARARTTAMKQFRTVLVALPVLVCAAQAAWFLPLALDEGDAEASPQIALAATQDNSQEDGQAPNGQTPPEAAPETAPAVQPPSPVEAQTTDPLEHLRIMRQSFQRGGLGSKALVTFTLRNDNDYAVKDPEIVCAFRSGDGSYVTERRRTIHDTVNTRSRKTFPSTLMGFVNIKASEARCSLLAAVRGQDSLVAAVPGQEPSYHPKARSVAAPVRRMRAFSQLRRVGHLLWALRN
jgi:hypothetical protein